MNSFSTRGYLSTALVYALHASFCLFLQLCEELFEKINDNCNEEMSYSVEVSIIVG